MLYIISSIFVLSYPLPVFAKDYLVNEFYS